MKSLLTSVNVDCKCILSQAQFLCSVGVPAECKGSPVFDREVSHQYQHSLLVLAMSEDFTFPQRINRKIKYFALSAELQQPLSLMRCKQFQLA